MAAQAPIVLFFAIKWMPQSPRQAVPVPRLCKSAQRSQRWRQFSCCTGRISENVIKSEQMTIGARTGLVAILTLIATSTSAQQRDSAPYANPIDIDYRYNFEQKKKASVSAPALIRHRGAAREYYLFETIGEVTGARATSAPGNTSLLRAGQSMTS
jgi:hypothetical protein